MARRRVGTVIAVRRYPVKSMRAEAAAELALGWNGFEGDRQFAFVKDGDASRFPWLTGRDLAELVLYRAEYQHPDAPSSSTVQVRAPDGALHDVADPRLAQRLAAAAGTKLRLMRLGRGAFDSMPVSVQTSVAAEALAREQGAPVSLDRFRGNIVIETAGTLRGNQELIGASLVFEGASGAARLRADKHIPRCRMITLDPDTAAKDMSVLRTVVQRFDNLFGLYCTTEATGRVAVGDGVWME